MLTKQSTAKKGGFFSGLRVVALEQAVAGPLASARLAQAGADVIKVERPEGDFARYYDSAVVGESAYFVWLNAGKRSVVLNFKSPAGRDALTALIASADVVIQNLKPGALAAAGIDLEALRREHPALITCSISGYSSLGPSAAKKAYDLLIQAETGLASITGSEHAAGRVGVSVCDIGCGLAAFANIQSALLDRTVTGVGRAIEVSLFDSIVDWLAVPYLLERHTGAAPKRVGLAHPGISPYGVFRSSDGQDFVLSIQNEREWQRLCKGLHVPDLLHDPRAKDNQTRVANRPFVDGTVADAISTHTWKVVSTLLEEADIAFAPVNDLAALASHPDLVVHTISVAGQNVDLPAPPGYLGLVHTPAARDGEGSLPAVPSLGAHTQEVLAELGMASTPE